MTERDRKHTNTSGEKNFHQEESQVTVPKRTRVTNVNNVNDLRVKSLPKKMQIELQNVFRVSVFKVYFLWQLSHYDIRGCALLSDQ